MRCWPWSAWPTRTTGWSPGCRWRPTSSSRPSDEPRLPPSRFCKRRQALDRQASRPDETFTKFFPWASKVIRPPGTPRDEVQMTTSADFRRRFEMTIPVVLAPMGGGPSTPELAAAVSNAGGLGSLAAAYSNGERIEQDIAAIRKLTNRPFAVNLFSPQAQLPLNDGVQAVADFL